MIQGGQGWLLRHLSDSMRQLKYKCGMYLKRFQKKINADLPPYRRGSWAMAGLGTSPKCLIARRKRSVAESTNWSNYPTIPQPDAFAAAAQVEKKVTPGSKIESNLQSLTNIRTAGDPDDEQIVFTDLTPTRLEQELAAMQTPAGDDLIRQWMEEQGLRLRKIRKVLPGGKPADRDAQFQNIAALIGQYESAGNPYFSIDTKAKEFLGKLFRKGRVRCTKAFEAFDHDFPSWADGVIIPHGIFDPVRNRGHINIGLSRDTTEFACDSLQWYWNRIGKQCYPDADSMLLLCDGGGSNSASKYIFKHDLQAVANRIGMSIQVAHYPSYCSKYNPIERRLFPHLSRACTGMLFDTLKTVVDLMRRASTSTGLRTTVNVIRRVYETGRNASDEMKDTIRSTINFADVLPKWNYTIKPQIGH
jgi:hypothetical protein